MQAQGNEARLGNPIPVIYGRHLIYPDFASQPHYRYINDEQYVYQLHCIGQGEYDIEQIRIEDTPISSFSEITYQIIPPGEKNTLFRDDVVTSAEVAGNKKENEVVTTSASSQSSKIAEDKSKTEQVSKPVQKVESANKAETKQKVSKDTLFAKDGVWRIQLLSSGEQKAVNDAWKRIYRKHKSILEGYEHEVTSANVKGKTTYRLRVKAFASRADANKVCNLLKAAKQDCMVVKN